MERNEETPRPDKPLFLPRRDFIIGSRSFLSLVADSIETIGKGSQISILLRPCTTYKCLTSFCVSPRVVDGFGKHLSQPLVGCRFAKEHLLLRYILSRTHDGWETLEGLARFSTSGEGAAIFICLRYTSVYANRCYYKLKAGARDIYVSTELGFHF